MRTFKYDNSLIGFFGFGENQAYSDGVGTPPSPAYGSDFVFPNAAFGSSGVRRCLTTATYGIVNPKDPPGTLLPASVSGSPCTDLGVQNQDGTISPKRTKGDGTIYKLNLSWKATPNAMLYGTVSKGFRPGGINRRSTVADYAPRLPDQL
ncbi:MAG: TonB-dependent receptor [Asticcacaulis sp.]